MSKRPNTGVPGIDERGVEIPVDEAKPNGADGKQATTPTRYMWTDPEMIPARCFLYGRHLSRGQLSATIAPGGVGKSILTIAEALALTSGKPLLGDQVGEPCRVWIYNLEDPRDELARRIQATALHCNLTPDDFVGRLFVDSGHERPLWTTMPGQRGPEINSAVFKRLREAIEEHKIDVLIIDPFKATHRLPESDNSEMDALARAWAHLADECGCAVELVHHARKLNGEVATSDSSRGARALVDCARDVRVLNRMTDDEATQASVDTPWRYFRVQSDKRNLTPPEEARWYRLESIDLGNGDSVGVVAPWKWPGVFDSMTSDDLRAVQRALDGKDARKDARAGNWAGYTIAEVLGLNPEKDKARIHSMIKTWIETDALRVAMKPGPDRKDKPCLIVGEWAK